MKRILSTAFALCLMASLFAQTYTKRCGSYDVIKSFDQQHPGYEQQVNTCFEKALQLAKSNRDNRSADDTIYRIRVVFHVVYTAPEENIPDSVIQSQIEVLNEDYRRTTADTVKTRDVFKPVAGDTHIEFVLATTDPDGNPTNGITRTQGAPTGFLGFEPFTDNVKTAATGGKDCWPTDRYLNVWVCNIMNGLGVLGYAFPPVNAPNWDAGSSTDSAHQGVVLHYPCVGRNFTAPIDPTVAGGRSAVHEIGHYLGLRHIWGDTTGCNKFDGDGIDDTPKASDAHQQTCDTTDNSCVDAPVDVPDMIENYMDYSDDRCLNMFTHHQIDVMHAMLQTSRAGIADVFVNGATNIKDPQTPLAKISVYPNPAGNSLHITLPSQLSQVQYTLLNALGEKLNDGILLNATTLDLSSQPAGIYFLRFMQGDQISVQKFQKN